MAQFHKAVQQKQNCLTNFSAKQTFSGVAVTAMSTYVILAGNLFRLSNTCLCLARFVFTGFMNFGSGQDTHIGWLNSFSQVLLGRN